MPEDSCDARGFIGCIAGTVCSPGMPVVTGKSEAAPALRTKQCAAAPRLTASPGSTLGCNDGKQSQDFSSKLELKNVPAGDYSIVIESIPPPAIASACPWSSNRSVQVFSGVLLSSYLAR